VKLVRFFAAFPSGTALISCTDRVKAEEAFRRVKEEKNILHTIKRRKAERFGHILRRNCLLKHAIKGKTEARSEVTGRRGRRSKQLLDDLKEMRGYWKLKVEALCRPLW
jgi:hypothetical protein